MLNFLGIGAQKAGTTWLYEMLRLHPDISFPSGKELHFWDRPYAEADKVQYLNQFNAHDRCNGEITPAYAMLDEATITDTRNAVPNLRLIFIIRNPIERAWSSALMALEFATMMIHEASDQWFIDHFRSAGSIARGDYQSTIINWRRAFGDQSICILRYEQLTEDPRGLLETVAAHLGVTPQPFAQIPDTVLRRRVFPPLGEPIRPCLRESIRPSLRPVLETLYRHRIQSLAQYLDEPLPW